MMKGKGNSCRLHQKSMILAKSRKLWKDNMWGLLGLKLCLEARGDAPEELAEVTALFEERSARADIVPAKTCFCAQDALAKTCCN